MTQDEISKVTHAANQLMDAIVAVAIHCGVDNEDDDFGLIDAVDIALRMYKIRKASREELRQIENAVMEDDHDQDAVVKMGV